MLAPLHPVQRSTMDKALRLKLKPRSSFPEGSRFLFARGGHVLAEIHPVSPNFSARLLCPGKIQDAQPEVTCSTRRVLSLSARPLANGFSPAQSRRNPELHPAGRGRQFQFPPDLPGWALCQVTKPPGWWCE